MANAPRDGERTSQGARPWASAASPVEEEWENFGSAGRQLAKIKRSLSGTPQITKLRAEGSPDICPVRAALCFLQDLCSSGLALRALLVLLFTLEGRGVSAYSTLPTSRLLNDYFLGSGGRSQLTRPAPFVQVGSKEPLGRQTASAKVSLSSLLRRTRHKLVWRYLHLCEMWTENSLSLSRVGLIIPPLTGDGDERESRCWAGGRIGGKPGSSHCVTDSSLWTVKGHLELQGRKGESLTQYEQVEVF